MNRKLPKLPIRPIKFERRDPAFCRLVDYRAPKKGEYFLSGAEPEGWLAKNDMDVPYWIIVPHEEGSQHVFIWETHECPKCNSNDIEEMASARWNESKQSYEICSIDDPCRCHSCGQISARIQIRRIDATRMG